MAGLIGQFFVKIYIFTLLQFLLLTFNYPQQSSIRVLRWPCMNEGRPTALELAVVKTLVWFSLFEYPLTSFDLWKYLYQPDKKYSLSEVERVLSESQWLAGKVKNEGGFYFLSKENGGDFVSINQQRFLDAARKYKKLRRAARYFSLFPFVRAVFACNNLPWHNTSFGSDIDLFVVVEPGTIWLSRLLLVFPFALFKNRPNNHSQITRQSLNRNFSPLLPHPIEDPERSLTKLKGSQLTNFTPPPHYSPTPSDPFCFSFFTTTDNLNFKKLLLADEDPYFIYWLASLVPIFDRGEVQKKIWQENNWLKEILPNVFSHSSHEEIFPRPLITLPIGFLKKFETAVRFWQKKFLPHEIGNVANQDSRVVISDQMLKFHTNDRRIYFRNTWQKILAKNL